MSGHSKWATIRRDKGLNDSKKGALFTKLSKDISIASKAGGGDPNMNATLASAIAKAKVANMPNDKIQKAIDRGIGVTKSGITLSELSYEGYAPGDVGLIIDASTDNKNRTIGEIKSMLEKNGGRFAEGGSVSWNFDTKGYIYIPFETSEEKDKRESLKWGNKDEKQKLIKEDAEGLELELMDQEGVMDINNDQEGMEIYTAPDSVGKLRKFIEDEKNIFVDDSDILKISKTPVEVDDETRERIESLIEKLEEHDDVQKVSSALS